MPRTGSGGENREKTVDAIGYYMATIYVSIG